MSIEGELLTILEEQREHFSEQLLPCQEIADRLSVTLETLRKAVKGLQMQGHQILAVPNLGYRLQAQSDVLSPQGIRLHLVPTYRDTPVLVYQTLDSTNTLAKRLAVEGGRSGTVVVANEQTAGRGRQGRSFYSPGDTGLYLSVLLRPQGAVADVVPITIAAAVAVCRALEATTGKRALVKWVNDIFMEGRKVGGILTEALSVPQSDGVHSLVVGIGINLQPPREGFPPGIDSIAGSILKGGGEPILRNRVAAQVVNHLLSLAEDLSNRGRYLEEYRSRSLVLGRELTYKVGNQIRVAKALDITEDGGLLVETADAEQVVLHSGEVSLRSTSYTDSFSD